MGQGPLRVRWLGRVGYRDALALQHGLFRHSKEDHLLLLEHPDVYTLGVRAKREHVLVDPSGVGAEFVRVDRGGDVTYHGPGQLVGYPICSLPMGPKAVPQFVHAIESFVIDVVRDLGLHDVGRVDAYPGVWVDPLGARPRKLCAIGIRVSRGRTMHGFALNIDPNMSMFDNIVPCGIQEYPVTSLRKEGLNVTMFDVVDAFCERATSALAFGPWTPERMMERQGISFAQSLVVGAPLSKERPLVRRLLAAGVNPSDGFDIAQRKPSWLRAEAKMGEEYLGLRRTMRRLNLVTVCEEAGCPNIYECWNDGTATFMINGERCTRACGFCLVDTRRPEPIDPNEPQRVAEAVARMNLAHVVVTAVARDDLTDGGASGFANTIKAIRTIRPLAGVEVLIPDVKGDDASLRTIFDALPDVLNHNLETVLRLQRAVRPSASYARSLSVLARAKAAGLTTKSGMILGMGETKDEVIGALFDLAGVGVDIVTLGQYLRPSEAHLPVARYIEPEEFASLGEVAREIGFSHVEASPLTRSSYHARQAIASATHQAIIA